MYVRKWSTNARITKQYERKWRRKSLYKVPNMVEMGAQGGTEMRRIVPDDVVNYCFAIGIYNRLENDYMRKKQTRKKK